MNAMLYIKQHTPRWAKNIMIPLVVGASRASHSIKAAWNIIYYYGVDLIRYMRHSCRIGSAFNDYYKISSAMILFAHSLEKGLTLPEIRAGYGADKVRKCVELLSLYRKQCYPENSLAERKVRAVLTEYLRYHDRIKFDLGSIRALIEPLITENCEDGGCLEKEKKIWIEEARGDFLKCALSRYSVRTFSDEPVDMKLLYDAVSIARKTPSVCNRQAWHLYVVKDNQTKNKIFELQGGGSRGFGHHVDSLLVVTTNIEAFVGAEERNESYIDGGLFSMSLMYALHYKGLGVCPLNWMVSPRKNKQLQRLLDMPTSYNIITLLAVGNLPEKIIVAKSIRHDANSIITVR